MAPFSQIISSQTFIMYDEPHKNMNIWWGLNLPNTMFKIRRCPTEIDQLVK